MRVLRLPVGVIAAAVLVLAMPAMAHAKPTLPQYAGRDGFRWYVQIAVSSDGRRLTGFDLGFRHGRCSDHEPYYSDFADSIRHSLAIGAAGRVSYSSGFTPRATFVTARGKVVKGREEIKFDMRFSAGRLDGTLHDNFKSAKLRCSSGPVRFTAYALGSAQAPLHNATTTTGHYTGTTNESGRTFSLWMFLPQRWVTSLRIGWTATCRNGFSFHSATTLYFLPVAHARFSFHTAGLVPANRQGLSERFRMRLTGRFSLQGASYYALGTWKWSDEVYRASRKVGACSTGRVTYSATGHSLA